MRTFLPVEETTLKEGFVDLTQSLQRPIASLENEP
jgi:hypothetical protein